MSHKRTERRIINNEWCRLEVELRETDKGLELSITGTAGIVFTQEKLVAHSCGQLREELTRFFPEVVPFFRFHLNGLHAECEHQQARDESYATHPNAECLECGWKLGHGWHYRELPPEVIHWAKTGAGSAPSEPLYIAGPQFVVTGTRCPGIGDSESFKLNGAAPDDAAAKEQARKVLYEHGYEHVHVYKAKRVD